MDVAKPVAEEFVPEYFLRDLRSAARKADHEKVRSLLADRQRLEGQSAFYAEALSWVARAYFSKGHLAEAAGRAADAFALANRLLSEGVSTEPNAGVATPLATALGAAIEVCAHLNVSRGQREQAIEYLREMELRYQSHAFSRRIRKNLLQLTLPGKPAPPLDLSSFPNSDVLLESPFGTEPVLLFFWAHWCSDSRAQARILSRFYEATSSPLRLVAPTSLFGFVSKGTPVSVEEELDEVSKILAADYPILRENAPQAASPRLVLGERNLHAYGVSTFPTLVLVNAQGIVVNYCPGVMKLEALLEAAGSLPGVAT